VLNGAIRGGYLKLAPDVTGQMWLSVIVKVGNDPGVTGP